MIALYDFNDAMTESHLGRSSNRSRAHSGSPVAEDFLRLYSVSQRQIYSFIGTYFRDPADIDEVLQETSIVLWTKFAEFRVDGDFLRWAFGIARLEVLRHFRTQNKRGAPFDEQLIDLLAEERYRQIDYLDSRREALKSCLDKLNERDRTLIEECYRSGAPIKKVAERLSRPTNAVYQSLGRIRRALYECIDRTLSVNQS
jgi:RNA polymerase sigma-70 factor (ECF subfamily)